MRKCDVCGMPRGEGFRIVVAAPDVAPDGRFPAGNELLCRMCYFWALETIRELDDSFRAQWVVD